MKYPASTEKPSKNCKHKIDEHEANSSLMTSSLTESTSDVSIISKRMNKHSYTDLNCSSDFPSVSGTKRKPAKNSPQLVTSTPVVKKSKLHGRSLSFVAYDVKTNGKQGQLLRASLPSKRIYAENSSLHQDSTPPVKKAKHSINSLHNMACVVEPDDESMEETIEQQNFKTIEVQTDREKKKGPPCKAWEIAKAIKMKKAIQSDDDDDDDEDFDKDNSSYCPSSCSNSDSDDLDSIISDSQNHATDKTVLQEPQVISWHEVKGNHMQCGNGWQSQLQSFNTSDSFTHPVQVYMKFVDEEVLDCMVGYTNEYAQQMIAAGLHRPQSRVSNWVDTTAEEMKLFLGLIMYMGLVNMPSIHSYWKKTKLYRNTVAPQVMTRNRFQLLLRMWHLTSNSPDSLDRLQKVRTFVDLLVTKFTSAKCPGEYFAIDETMVPFRGRLKFRQYLPGKAHKYGIKLFKLCDPVGYTYKIRVYAGKEEAKATSLSTNVVLELSYDYLSAGRTIYTDNFYTSLELAKLLLEKQTHLVGTVRASRRDLPCNVKNARLKRGQISAAENDDGIVVMKWKDKRDVLMLTTKHDASMVNTGKVNRRKEVVIKPCAVIDYNKSKQGIDLSDQMSSYHACFRKTVRWFHKIGIEVLFGTCIVNALIIWNEQQVRLNKDKMSVTEFREMVCMSLLNIENAATSQSALANQDSSIIINEIPDDTHFLTETNQKESGKRSDRRRRRTCVGCYQHMAANFGREIAQKKAKRVTTVCSKCPNNPPFCFKCFPKFHMQ